MGKKHQKVVLPPELPPEVPDDEIEVSDEDFDFVQDNPSYAGFVSNLNTDTITKHVTRVADADDGLLESLHEKRLQRKLENNVKEQAELEVDPVDALPVKTLDGKLYYRRVVTEHQVVEGEVISKDPALVKLRKPEKHAKLKKLRKEAKKLPKEEEEKLPQAEVLVEVKKDLTAEEAREKKKYRLAELGTSLLVDPESNIKLIREMLEILKDGDSAIVVLSLKSLLAVFKDIIPGYRIRLPTEKEKEMKISKAVKKTRLYEFTLLTAYKTYIQRLVTLQRKSVYKQVALRCLCTLLEAVPHFNLRESLLATVVENISFQDDVVRKLCCNAIKSLFTNEGKHGGEATIEAVKLIANLVKAHDCELHPDSVEVFLWLSFDEDLGKSEIPDPKDRFKNKKYGKRKGSNKVDPTPDSTKKIRKENLLKTREEVNTDFKVASLAQDPLERRRAQTQTLSAVFETFFRILKHAGQPISESSSEPALGNHPLLAPCLNGIGKFSHLLDLDFMADLMQSLRKLAANGLKPGDAIENPGCQLSFSERLQCCIVAFKIMRNNLDALNIDLQEFFVQFYNLILEFRPGRDQGEVLAEALKIMLCDDRQHDMQRAAAFIKRLAMFSLCFGSAESMAALVTVKHLLQRNVKCRSLLENDIGGGLVAGAIAKYQPQATDPNRSGALASVLWELNLLSKHYHPAVSSMASSIAVMNTSNSQVYHSHVSPQQAYSELLLETKSTTSTSDVKVPNKRKRKGPKSMLQKLDSDQGLADEIDQEVVKNKLADHFASVCDFQEKKRLRLEADRTSKMLKLYQQYKDRKKKKKQLRS